MTVPFNLNLNQTPVSGLTDNGVISATTGSFFSRPAQPEMQGAQSLVGGASVQASGGVALALAASAVVLTLLIVRK